DDHLAARRYRVGVEHLEFYASVGEKDVIAGLHISGEMRIAGGCQRRSALNFFSGDAEEIAGPQLAMAVLECSQTDLGTLQIQQDSRLDAHFSRGGAHARDHRKMIVRRAVACIQAKYIYSRLKHVF